MVVSFIQSLISQSSLTHSACTRCLKSWVTISYSNASTASAAISCESIKIIGVRKTLNSISQRVFIHAWTFSFLIQCSFILDMLTQARESKWELRTNSSQTLSSRDTMLSLDNPIFFKFRYKKTTMKESICSSLSSSNDYSSYESTR